MNKNLLFLLCISSLSLSMEIELKKQGLKLVIGSRRKSDYLERFPYTQLWRDNTADFSHSSTYKGQATTFHFEKCPFADMSHITGDPRYYDFENNIEAVYLEQPFPHTRAIGFGKLSENEKYYIQHSIKHISKHMKQNATIEIEWLPFVIIDESPSPHKLQIFSREYSEKYPFSAKIHKDLLCKSLELLLHKDLLRKSLELFLHTESRQTNPCDMIFVNNMKRLSAIIKNRIQFYAAQKVSSQTLLKKRLREELLLWKYLNKYDLIVALSAGPSASPAQFSNALKKFYIAKQDIGLTNMIDKLKEGFFIYNADIILSNSLLYCLLCDIAAEYNREYAINFMKKNGFENVTMRRKTSPHNGRENTWILSGIKK